jgi:hypothetical protein
MDEGDPVRRRRPCHDSAWIRGRLISASLDRFSKYRYVNAEVQVYRRGTKRTFGLNKPITALSAMKCRNFSTIRRRMVDMRGIWLENL